MHCLASEPRPLRVYDHEYVETIDDDDSGGRYESPLEAGEAVNLWHDASFHIKYLPDRSIKVNVMAPMTNIISEFLRGSHIPMTSLRKESGHLFFPQP